MPWAKLDDHFHDNPKVRKAWRQCPSSLGLHVLAITYSAGHLLDGRVSSDFVADQIPNRTQRTKAVDALVDARLWLVTGDGWEINDYLDYNPPRAEVEAVREAKRKAGKAGGIKSGASRRGEAYV
jgi:hypothetical protein